MSEPLVVLGSAPSQSKKSPIVVLGAGVVGLTSALLLSRDPENAVTVIAKFMPGDYDVEYTSPWAGANVLPMAIEADSRWERRTWEHLKKLTESEPAAGIHFQNARIYRRNKDVPDQPGSNFYDALFAKDPWYKTMFDQYRELSPEDVPAGHDSGCEFTSLCINTQLFLPWLVSQCLKNGVVFKRAIVDHVADAAKFAGAVPEGSGERVIVVNATGLGALKLGGVEDKAMVPARGQIVLVRNEAPHMVATSGTEDGEEEACYIMTRAAGGGTILGGTYDKGNWNANPEPNIATRIMKRALEVCPELTGGKGIEALDIIRHGVGLRPLRVGGVRIEKEVISLKGGGGDVHVVHNYGHAGWGYQGSFGCAERVVELVNEIRGKSTNSA